MSSKHSTLQQEFTTRSVRYRMDVWHDGLNQFQVVQGSDPYVVKQKAAAKMAQWDMQWSKRQTTAMKQEERYRVVMTREQKVADAAQQTAAAQRDLAALEKVLAHTLGVDDTVDWDTLKSTGPYPVPEPNAPAKPPPPPTPTLPREPRDMDPAYQVEFGFLDRLVSSRREAKEQEAHARFLADYNTWSVERDRTIALHESRKEQHAAQVAALEAEHKATFEAWELDRRDYLRDREAANEAVEQRKSSYMGGEPEAVLEYCDLVLSSSVYPDYFPLSFELDYNAENRTLIVDYQLPAKESIPTTREVRYIATRDEFDIKTISDAQLNALYDGLLYQIALRSVHELYEADAAGALAAVVFNGYVRSIDRATGQEKEACLLSLPTSKAEFEAINLAAVDPKACFKALKGVGAAKLHSLTPIAPVMRIEREDARFTAGRAVVDGVSEGDNLAAMAWEDFEHLIRELFEKEFAAGGGEVRVTQASRDGGVDAVIFDPDPIRGGKIVVQAKRYTNTVGVGAVRDLYGTMMNEGAMKGILVTTSDYGPDAYGFAKGKPLTLLNGGNLLHLLERHGHRARIDVSEARAAGKAKDGVG